MKKLSMFSLFSAVMLTAGSAFAGGGNLLGGTGSSAAAGTMYGGASVGQATTACMLKNTEDCSSTGFKVYGGYRVTEMIAVEGGYYNLGSAEDKRTGSKVSNGYTFTDPSAEGEASGFGITGVVSLPVADNFEVFGKAGVMKWSSEGTLSADITDNANGQTCPKCTVGTVEKDGTSPLIGVGAGYKFNDNWGVRGEYEHFNRKDAEDKDEGVSILSVGATFSTL